MNSRIRTPFYILFLNPDYVAANSLRSLRSNKHYHAKKKKKKNYVKASKNCNTGYGMNLIRFHIALNDRNIDKL